MSIINGLTIIFNLSINNDFSIFFLNLGAATNFYIFLFIRAFTFTILIIYPLHHRYSSFVYYILFDKFFPFIIELISLVPFLLSILIS